MARMRVVSLSQINRDPFATFRHERVAATIYPRLWGSIGAPAVADTTPIRAASDVSR